MKRIRLPIGSSVLKCSDTMLLVDDDGLGAGRAVGVREAAPADDGYSGDLEECRADCRSADLRGVVYFRRRDVRRTPTGRRPTPNGGMLVVRATCSAPGMAARRGCSRS